MSYGKVYDVFWDDEEVARLSDKAAILAVFLIAGPYRNAGGEFWIGPGAISDFPMFAKWGHQDIVAALQELVDSGFCARITPQRFKVVRWGKWSDLGRLPVGKWRRLRRAVFERDDYICQYCGEQTDAPHCDHIEPVSQGGSNAMDNLATSCPACNLAKGAKYLGAWAP